jgi:hypothetical protein
MPLAEGLNGVFGSPVFAGESIGKRDRYKLIVHLLTPVLLERSTRPF